MGDSKSPDWRAELELSTVKASLESTNASEVRVPGLTVLAHPDPRRVGETAPLTELVAEREAALSRLEPLFAQPELESVSSGEPRPLADSYLSRQLLKLRAGTHPESIRLLPVARSADPVPVKVNDRELGDGIELTADDLDQGVVLLLAQRIALLLHRIDPTAVGNRPTLGLVGAGIALDRLRQSIENLAGLEVPVLIEGETGSGKELVAAALHRASARRNGPFVSVNMGAIPDSVAAAELFGASRGAFTGADRERLGFFRRANGGTLFLDEVGETPEAVQALLLRALETGEIQPLGRDRTDRVDVRVIAATDTDLRAAIDAGRFRAPLFHRLSGSVVRVPPLRERREDVGRLLFHFLHLELEACDRLDLLEPVGRGQQPWLPAALIARFAAASWRGNVRQLRNVVRHLVATYRTTRTVGPTPGADPQLENLLESSPVETPIASGAAPSVSSHRSERGRATGWHRQPSQIEDEELIETMRRHRWRVQPAARELGISRTSLYALVDRCPRLRRAGELGPEEIKASLEAVQGDLEAAVDLLEVSKQGLLQRMRELDIR